MWSQTGLRLPPAPGKPAPGRPTPPSSVLLSLIWPTGAWCHLSLFTMRKRCRLQRPPYWALPKPIQMRQRHHILDKGKGTRRQTDFRKEGEHASASFTLRPRTLTLLINVSTFIISFIPPTSLSGRNYCQPNWTWVMLYKLCTGGSFSWYVVMSGVNSIASRVMNERHTTNSTSGPLHSLFLLLGTSPTGSVYVCVWKGCRSYLFTVFA